MRVVQRTGGCLPVVVSAARYERECPHRATGTAGELQWRHHEQRAGRRQRGKVRELRNAILPRTEKIIVERERRFKASGRQGTEVPDQRGRHGASLGQGHDYRARDPRARRLRRDRSRDRGRLQGQRRAYARRARSGDTTTIRPGIPRVSPSLPAEHTSGSPSLASPEILG